MSRASWKAYSTKSPKLCSRKSKSFPQFENSAECNFSRMTFNSTGRYNVWSFLDSLRISTNSLEKIEVSKTRSSQSVQSPTMKHLWKPGVLYPESCNICAGHLALTSFESHRSSDESETLPGPRISQVFMRSRTSEQCIRVGRPAASSLAIRSFSLVSNFHH